MSFPSRSRSPLVQGEAVVREGQPLGHHVAGDVLIEPALDLRSQDGDTP